MDGFSVRRFGHALPAGRRGTLRVRRERARRVHRARRAGHAYGHRRRRRAIERLRDHTIISEYSTALDATPSADEVLEAGAVRIGVGTTEELRLLDQLFAPAEEPVAA